MPALGVIKSQIMCGNEQETLSCCRGEKKPFGISKRSVIQVFNKANLIKVISSSIGLEASPLRHQQMNSDNKSW